jgi:hypothetical protein
MHSGQLHLSRCHIHSATSFPLPHTLVCTKFHSIFVCACSARKCRWQFIIHVVTEVFWAKFRSCHLSAVAINVWNTWLHRHCHWMMGLFSHYWIVARLGRRKPKRSRCTNTWPETKQESLNWVWRHSWTVRDANVYMKINNYIERWYASHLHNLSFSHVKIT